MDSTARRPLERIALTLFVLGLLVSLPLLTHPWFAAKPDSGMYVLTARSMLAGEGYALNGIPFQVRPPGFAALVAPFVAAGESDFLAANLLVGAFGVLAVLLLYRFCRPRLGWPLAMLLAAAVWMLPEVRQLCNSVLSDIPGIALLFLCLGIERWTERAPSWRRDVALGLAIGMSFYVRAPLGLLLPAVLCVRIHRRMRTGQPTTSLGTLLWKRLGILASTVALVTLPWPLHNARHPVETPVDQTRNYNYGTFMWHGDTGDPDSPRVSVVEVLQRIPERASEVFHFLGAGLDDHPQTESVHVLAVLLLIGLLYGTVRHRDVAEVFALGVLLILLISPDFLGRHLLPVFVLAIVGTAELLRDVGRRIHARAGEVLAVLGLFALLANHFDLRPYWSEVERKHRHMLRLVDEILPLLAEDARLASPTGWDYSVYLGCDVYNLRNAVYRAQDVGAVETVIDRYGINTVVLSPKRKWGKEFLPYFRETYTRVSPEEAIVFRVRDQ